MIHLFDLVVGTSIGGLIALAVTIGKSSGPLTVEAIKDEFTEMIRTAFDRKPPYTLAFGKKVYKTNLKTTEKCLKGFFGGETQFYSASRSSELNVPNVAVTTTVDPSELEPHLITN